MSIKFSKEQRELAKKIAMENLKALVVVGKTNGITPGLIEKMDAELDILEDDEEDDTE